MELIKNPTTVKLLSQQIIKACDLYLCSKLPEDKLRELIWYYGKYHGDKLFREQKLNSTLLNRIGKRRATLVERILCGFQISML
ncbi:MAG TPA: TIGR04540 family protein [Clostridiaceae bacterium]